MSDGPADQPSPERPRIIRRHPTGAMPHAAEAEPQTSLIGDASSAESQTTFIPPVAGRSKQAGPGMAVAAAVVSILSGWATAVIATDLITGWWRTDRLFCVAVGFLTTVSAAATIGGLILVLLRRRIGRLLVVVGSAIGLLIFGSLFVAGATFPPIVYAIPVLPAGAILLTAHPATGRWAGSG